MSRRILPLAIISLLFLGAGCFGAGKPQLKTVSLSYWSTDADAAAMQTVIAEYKKIHSNVDIALTVLRKDDYERVLLEALAVDRGPDLFTIPNTWVRGWQTKLLPLPDAITIPTRVVNDQQEIVVVNRATAVPTKGTILRDFVETVPKDVILYRTEGKTAVERIYGLPLSLDTPALFYNADLLKSADLKNPPTTWRDLQSQAERLTLLDENRAVKQSGAALGTATNVLYYTDILASLMLQNGAQMADEGNRTATFHAYTKATVENDYPPGVEALIFYESFAEPSASNYSWDASMPASLDAFVSGKTAFFVGFPADVAAVRERAPRLNFDVAPLPFITSTRKVTVAHYPVEVVSAKTAHANEAWDFLLFLTAPEQASAYLTAAKRPTALRSLISSQLSNPDTEVFAGQVLTAKSWYRGSDYPEAEKIFAQMIAARPTVRQPSYTPIVSAAANAIDRTR